MQKNLKDFFKMILSFSVCVAKHVQITQITKFATSLQYLKKEVSDEVDFLHADKHRGGFRDDFLNHFEELQNVLFEVELIINNAPLIYKFTQILSKYA